MGAAVEVIPDYLSRVVDALRTGSGTAWGIDGRVGAAAVEEADQAYSAKKTKKGVSSDTIVHAANVACGRSERRVNACQTFGISRQCDLKG